MFHNGEGMARILGIPNPERFASDFVYGLNGDLDPLMLPSRMQSNRGAGGGGNESEFCLAVRVWDVLVFFSIMGVPRRDISLLTDFSKTLVRCSLQLLPRSIFPYEVVPMCRPDHITKKQVILEMHYEPDEYDAIRIPRPLVIPRSKNEAITSENFSLACAGKLGAGVLEDEMYMSEIVMMASDINLDWFRLPLNELPGMNIAWEYNVCFPLVRYFTPQQQEEDDEKDSFLQGVAQDHEYALVFLHPGRFSMMLWVMQLDSLEHVENSPGPLTKDWNPEMVLTFPSLLSLCLFLFLSTSSFEQELCHEFSLLPCLPPVEDQGIPGGGTNSACMTLACNGMQEMQNKMFSLGFGPIPLFRRTGVLLR